MADYQLFNGDLTIFYEYKKMKPFVHINFIHLNLRLTIFHRNSITSIIIVKFLIMGCKHCAGQLV